MAKGDKIGAFGVHKYNGRNTSFDINRHLQKKLTRAGTKAEALIHSVIYMLRTISMSSLKLNWNSHT